MQKKDHHGFAASISQMKMDIKMISIYEYTVVISEHILYRLYQSYGFLMRTA